MKEIIIGRRGNQKTPISDQSVSREHCKVTVHDDGTYTIENLSQNGTKVDGRDVIRTKATLNSRLQLGPTFTATLVELIGAPAKAPVSAPQPQQPTATQKPQKDGKAFNISHLRKVWEDFNQANIDNAKQQRKVTQVRTGSGIATVGAAAAGVFLGPVGWVLTAAGIAGNVYSFVGMKNAESPEERQKRQEEFDEAWVCPNPECHRTLPAKNYNMLVRNFKSCPYCHCKFVEE